MSPRTCSGAASLGLLPLRAGQAGLLDALDGRADPLPSGPLGSVGRLRAEGPVRIGDAVGVPVLLDFGGGLAPGPPAPGRLGNWPERLEDIARALLLSGQLSGASLPGQGPHDLPMLEAEMRVGFQPAVANVLMLAQLPLPVMGPVELLGRHRQPTRYSGQLVVAAP